MSLHRYHAPKARTYVRADSAEQGPPPRVSDIILAMLAVLLLVVGLLSVLSKLFPAIVS